MEALAPAILEQKVTGDEARRAWRGLVRRYGEPAPGPAEFGLRVPPAAERPGRACPTTPTTRSASSSAAPTSIRRAARARRLAGGDRRTCRSSEAYARLTALPGIGPWTAAEVAVRALGDPDAVSVGDFHLPNLVAFALAGEPRADDARMLELLEPCRGERGRVIRLLELSGLGPPRSTARGCRRVASSATDRTLVTTPREERRTTSTATTRTPPPPADRRRSHAVHAAPPASPGSTTLLRERILVLDGAMGTLIQSYGLGEADYRGERFADHRPRPPRRRRPAHR